jgi:hypothetical protein
MGTVTDMRLSQSATPDIRNGMAHYLKAGCCTRCHTPVTAWLLSKSFGASAPRSPSIRGKLEGGEYNYAKTHSPDKLATVRRKFAAAELAVRFRFILWLLYTIIVGSHIALYLNSKQCLIPPAPKVQQWATEMYGNRTPVLCSEYRF